MRVEVSPMVLGMFEYRFCGKDKALIFQFNPETISRSRTVRVNESKVPNARGTPSGDDSVVAGQTFASSAGSWSMSLKMRLDSSVAAAPEKDAKRGASSTYSFATQLDGLEAALSKLEELVEPTADPNEKNTSDYPAERTPLVTFHWGKRSWDVQISSISITETMFTPDLRPARVEADVTMTVLRSVQSVTSGDAGGGGR